VSISGYDPVFSPLFVSQNGRFAAWFPSGSTLVTPIFVSDGENIQQLEYKDHNVISLAVANDGSRVYVLHSNTDNLMTLVELVVHREARRDLSELLDGLTAGVTTIRVAEGGETVVIGSEKDFRVVDVATNSVVWRADGHDPSLSPDGTQVAFISSGSVMVVTMGAGIERKLQIPGTAIGIGSWAPDGLHLLVGVETSGGWAHRLLVVNTRNGLFYEVAQLGAFWGREASWISLNMVKSDRSR
jgi:hypothetical protein